MTDKKKMGTRAKINYKRHRIMSGHSPHKLFKMEIKKYLAKRDLFDIDNVKWKGLDATVI